MPVAGSYSSAEFDSPPCAAPPAMSTRPSGSRTAEWPKRPVAIEPVGTNGEAGAADSDAAAVGPGTGVAAGPAARVAVGAPAGDPEADLPQPVSAKARSTAAGIMLPAERLPGLPDLDVMACPSCLSAISVAVLHTLDRTRRYGRKRS